ncbi:hypothetical protein P152DRAFT_296912 [Eremomyces bilateralis CBS 781.70]|uniref:Uncharacterized protein n=1 Tax=Eremomyces bilateralis CBS 781.70 TaxID=1392243 RepID=A0A6G1G764_9PEZI|nr:uncharacterized protein P152DRAFT_296912 [Eremomyces bilateralis CBS 781.70]KAF1813888.1 hypothetical protein P152DRAFT_296912 [Eremomyces bilateralis CBS 781.70]
MLASHHRNFVHNYRRTSTEFTADPRVIKGRFILCCKWTIQEEAHTPDLTLSRFPHVRICPHLSAFSRPQSHQVERSLNRSPRIRARKSHSCDGCWTDYAVDASPKVTTFEPWQDFGTATCIRPLQDSTARHGDAEVIPCQSPLFLRVPSGTV